MNCETRVEAATPSSILPAEYLEVVDFVLPAAEGEVPGPAPRGGIKINPESVESFERDPWQL